ncbi:MAG TPA: electron transfer flavoprotein subunit alpha/FixB family protein [Acidimicrobiaceae bacterium]|nr:electron transfer flavoprotein subunit alpha/FixB family protein [Acidimicrobiaceae bacterium]
MIAVIVVRDGVLPQGADEAVAECGGRALLAGTSTAAAAADPTLLGVATEVVTCEIHGLGFRPAAYASVIAPLLASEPHVVLPGSPDGRDLAPRLAALLHRPLHAGAVSIEPGRIDLARKGSTELHRVSPGASFIATLQPGVRGVASSPPAATAHVVAVTSSEPQNATGSAGSDAAVLDVLPPDPASIDLGEAPRIVAAGAGLDGPARIEQLTSIGASIGASMGATRVVTDRGWVPHARQIGTTGVVVNPRLYLAFGISGAVQHTAGLGHPDHTISVNTDAHCPMMQLADLAIVADANATLDALEQLL